MSGFRGSGHRQYRVSSAERVGHGFFGQRVGHPLTVHHQTVFVGAGRQVRVFQLMAFARRMHGFGGGLPLVESSRDAHRCGRGMSEFKANGHELNACARDVVVIAIVFHSSSIIRKERCLCYGVLPDSLQTSQRSQNGRLHRRIVKIPQVPALGEHCQLIHGNRGAQPS